MSGWHDNGLDKDLIKTATACISEGIQGTPADAQPVFDLLVKKGIKKPSEKEIYAAMNEYYRSKGWTYTNIKRVMFNDDLLGEIVTAINQLVKRANR